MNTHLSRTSCGDCGGPLSTPRRGPRGCAACSHRKRLERQCRNRRAAGIQERHETLYEHCCAVCHIEFKTRKKRRTSCSDACEKVRRSAAALRHICEICGENFPHKRGRSANRCCSRECGWEAQRRDRAAGKDIGPHFPVRTCPCGEVFRSRHNELCEKCRSPRCCADCGDELDSERVRTCPECRARRREANRLKNLEYQRELRVAAGQAPTVVVRKLCPWCGDDFEVMSSPAQIQQGKDHKKRYCSALCTKAAANFNRERRRGHPERPFISLIDVAARSRWTCHICGGSCQIGRASCRERV